MRGFLLPITEYASADKVYPKAFRPYRNFCPRSGYAALSTSWHSSLTSTTTPLGLQVGSRMILSLAGRKMARDESGRAPQDESALKASPVLDFYRYLLWSVNAPSQMSPGSSAVNAAK